MTSEETMTPDVCACGAPMEGKKTWGRSGCNACEKKARLAFHDRRPPPLLPSAWWRRFEPEWSCGPYYLYGRSDLVGTDFNGRELKTIEIVSACESGVSIDSVQAMTHLLPEEVEALRHVLFIAKSDHIDLKAFEDNLEAFVASLNRMSSP